MEPDAAEVSVARIRVDGRIVAAQRHFGPRPAPVEERLFQGFQILFGHLVVPVDQVGLRQPFVGPDTFLEVRDQFLRLEGIALAGIDHAELEIGFGRDQRVDVVVGVFRKQAVRAVLVEVEQPVGVARLDERQVHAGHLERLPGIVFPGFREDGVPLEPARQEVVFEIGLHLAVIGQEDAQGAEGHHRAEGRGSFPGLARPLEEWGKDQDQRLSRRGDPRPRRHMMVEPVVVDAVQEPVVRIAHRLVEADDAQGEDGCHQQARQPLPLVDQTGDDEQHGKRPQQEIEQGGRDDSDPVPKPGGADAEDRQGAEQRQQDRHQRAGHGVGVAAVDQQQDGRDVGQRISER